MVIARARNRRAQQPLPLVDRAHDRRAEHEELHVVVRVRPRAEQIVAFVVADRPVDVLARSVDAGKRLLVQQAREPVLRRRPPHRLHRHHLVIGGHVRVLEDRRDFVLTGRHLVVTRLHRHADLVQFALHLRHERHHALGNRAEILIFELLTFGRPRAEERSSGVDEIGPGQIEIAVDQEILLLGPARGHDALGRGAEEAEHADRLLRERLHRSQQRRLLVERFAGPAHERRRDDERHRAAAVKQPGRTGRIPCGVTPCFKSAAHAAGRKARGIGLALDQLLARELGDGLALVRELQKRIVLLRRDAGERLKPVRVVRGAVLDRPFFHSLGDGVCRGRIERLAVRHRPPQRVIHQFGEAGLLHFVVEHEVAESVRCADRDSFFLFGNREVSNRVNGLNQHRRTHGFPLFCVQRPSANRSG